MHEAQSPPADLERFLEDRIAAGRFRSKQEALTEALELLRARERKRDALLADVQEGLDELAAGDRVDGEAVLAELATRANEDD